MDDTELRQILKDLALLLLQRLVRQPPPNLTPGQRRILERSTTFPSPAAA